MREEDKCVWYKAGIEQRNNETKRGEDERGTIGWDKRGCFECKGEDKTKNCYVVMRDI